MTADVAIPLGQIAALVNGTLEGDAGTAILGPGSLDHAETGQIVFVESPELLPAGEQSAASALIVPPAARTTAKPIIVTENPRLAFSKVLELFAPTPRTYPGVHPTAVVGKGVRMGEGVSVGAHAVIEDDVTLDEGCVIYPLAYIGHEAVIGADSRILPHVFIGERVVIGRRTMIHAGAMVGCDGFGFLPTPQGHRKIPQVGTVIIGDDVEIGACSTVDRATVGATRIGNGTKIDDHVHVAHNCVLGDNCLLCGQVGIAGSTTVGDNVVMGGQAGINDHVRIGNDIIIAGRAVVFGNIDEPGMYSGYPARPHQSQLRVSAATQKMPDVIRRLRALEAQVKRLAEARTEGDDETS